MMLSIIVATLAGGLLAQAATPTPTPLPSTSPAATASPSPSIAPSPVPSGSGAVASAPPCALVTTKLLETIDTKIVKPGERFRFATVTAATLGSTMIPLGTQGTGFIATLDHSKSHGESGYLVLEARYLELADGSHLPVTFVPAGDGRSDAYVRAGSSDAPGLVGYIPYVGTAASVYDFFHHGKDAAVIAGAPLVLVLGDGLLTGTCSVPTR